MNHVFEHYRGNEQLVARILDWMDQSERRYRCIITPFLTPQELQIAEKVIGKQLYVYTDGGYANAERKRLMMAPFACDSADLSIACLQGHYHKNKRILTHRDILGSLMHMGIQRNQLGDLLVQNEDIYILVRRELSEWLMQECTQIGGYPLALHRYEGTISFEQKLAWHQIAVSSMRLDSVVSACIHVSRTKAQTLIHGKCVKVNQIPLEDCRYLCNNNCTVSIRGYGRFAVNKTDRIGRKGKQVIEIGAYQ